MVWRGMIGKIEDWEKKGKRRVEERRDRWGGKED